MFFYRWGDTRACACWNHSFSVHLSCLEPGSCTFLSWVPSGLTFRADCSGWWLDGHSILCLLIRQATFYIHNHSKYNNNESLKYCENYQTVTQRQEVSKGCWENGADRLLLGVTNRQFVNEISMKHNKAKHNKMMCICILSWYKILFFILNYIQALPWTLFYELMTNSREICWHK